MSCNHSIRRGALDIGMGINGHGWQKTNKKTRSLLAAFIIINAAFVIILAANVPVTASSIESRVEPIIIRGSDISYLNGKSIDDIGVFSYIGGTWEQIPFQIDERNDINGSYFFSAEDGVLDSNDEIVFMPKDCGLLAPENSRVLGVDPLRTKINVKDPIDMSDGYAYIYTSSDLVKTFTSDYVDYDIPSDKIIAEDYAIGFNATHSGVIDEVRVGTSIGGDGTDFVDRFKYRFQKTIEIIPDQYDEDDFASIQVGLKDGPVRVISQLSHKKMTADFSYMLDDLYFAYGSYLKFAQEMSTNTSTDWVEITMDLLGSQSPVNYYDSNSNELIIDGTPDPLQGTETPTWFEVSGAAGTMISIANFSEMGGTSSLIYTDDLSSVDVPESETGEYGNFGISAINPPQSSTITLSHYFTSANQENIGEDHLNYTEKSLELIITSKTIDPSPPPVISNINSEPDPQELNGIIRLSADVEDNLDELESVYVSITDPENNELGNYSMEQGSGADEYYFEAAFDVKGTYEFIIWAMDDNGNTNYQSGQFTVVDTTSPEIKKISLIPLEIGVGESINISASISDLGGPTGAWIDIMDPDGTVSENVSMILDPEKKGYFYVHSYEIVGFYAFTIWTKDASDNWNYSRGQFEVLDTVDPQANAGSDQNGNTGTIIQFDAVGSSDNVAIVNYTWTFSDGEEKVVYGENPSYRFLNEGHFEVVLRVEDAKGNFDTATMFVNITELITVGSISGTVTNSDGNPIAGAKVWVENISSEVVTDGTGNYLIEDIPAGIYDITITRDGYKSQTLDNVVVVARETTSDVFVTMDKKSTAKDREEDGGILWLILVVMIVGILIVVFLLARPKKQTEIVEEVIEELQFLCPECGTLVNYDMKNCPGCGVEFGEGETQEEVVEKKEPQESEADIYMCPSCGSFVSAKATKCEKCGYDFEGDDEVSVNEEEVAKKEVTIPQDIKAKMAKEVETLISENDFEMEEVEMELEVELGEDIDGESSIGAKEILELFKEELKSDDVHDDPESDYNTLSKEIDEILGDNKDDGPKENKKDAETEE